MDARRFDRLARALAAATSRRSALAAVAGALLAGSVADASTRRRRKRCQPACAAGQTCVHGVCACNDGGTPCGANCCAAGEECASGTCRAPQPACIPFGEACKNVGRPCCGTLACGSGQGGAAVACYVPAGGPCADTAECVYGAICRNGICEAIVPPPPCLAAGPDALANGAALQAAIDAAAPGAAISLSAGTYDADFVIRRAVSLVACPGVGAGEVTLRNATREVATLRIVGGPVRLQGLTVTRGTDPTAVGGGIVVATPEALALVRRLLREHDTVEAGVAAGIPIARQRLRRRGARAFSPGLEVTVTDCVIADNVATRGDGGCPVGGGIFLADGRLVLDGATVVRGNTAMVDGGGIYVASGELVLAGTTRVEGNSADDGGGIEAVLGSVSLGPDVRITGNRAGGFIFDNGLGGGLHVGASVALTPPAAELSAIVSGNTGGGCANVAVETTCFS